MGVFFTIYYQTKISFVILGFQEMLAYNPIKKFEICVQWDENNKPGIFCDFIPRLSGRCRKEKEKNYVKTEGMNDLLN